MARGSDKPKKPTLPPTNVVSPNPVQVKGTKTEIGKTSIDIGSKVIVKKSKNS